MIAAAQKRQENIVEYILYMWHIEDLLRSLNLDMNEVRDKLLPGYDTDPQTRSVIEQWYTLLIKEMRESGLQEKGHIEEINELLRELDFLHSSLLHLYRDNSYRTAWEKATDDIEALRIKSGKDQNNSIQTGLTALYGVLVLKLKGKSLFEETEEAITHISTLFALLARRYKEMKNGRLELSDDLRN
jgi:signal recognition particle subunit SEC65